MKGKVKLMIISFEKCYICGKISHFSIEDNAKLLREAICEFCNSSLRNSDTAKILVKSLLNRNSAIEECKNELLEFKILEAQASGSINQALKNSLNYTCFEYFDDIKPGEMNGEVLCNNLENLTFEDNSFDVLISQDVLEHVVNPTNAFSEIKRVLKPGGKHIFTVPLHQGRQTICRSNLPPVFHGDPIRESGALVQFDWGDDIIDIIYKQGMSTITHALHIFYSNDELTDADLSYDEYLKTPPLMYYRYNSIVLESKK